MKKMIRDSKSVKSVKIASLPQTQESYRRFIPDARPMTQHSGRGAFWSKIWLSQR